MKKIVALYTETLEELLENKGYGTVSQDAVLTEILGLMEKIPAFVFGEDISLNFTSLFMEKYDIREIGSETEELFLHYWREKTNEILIAYVPKIQMWLDNFNDLFKFKVTLDIADNQNYSNGRQDTYYLNPVTANTEITKTVVVDETNNTTTTTFSGGKLKTEDVSTSDDNGQKSRIIHKDVLQSVWGKTRPMILEHIMDLKSIYTDALNEYEKIFMGVF